MDKYRLPTSTDINGIECEFFSDYRDIITIFQILNDPDLVESEKILMALDYFYKTDDYFMDIETAVTEMFNFISCSDGTEDAPPSNQKPIYDWEQDFNIIIAPVNKVIGTDIRGLDYLHWWTFLSAFMEIGECTFSTYVSIRNKLNKHKKLEKYEKELLKENRNKIILKQKVDSTTQALMDEIMGKGV